MIEEDLWISERESGPEIKVQSRTQIPELGVVHAPVPFEGGWHGRIEDGEFGHRIGLTEGTFGCLWSCPWQWPTQVRRTGDSLAQDRAIDQFTLRVEPINFGTVWSNVNPGGDTAAAASARHGRVK
jgi:hypothetical protein